MTHLEYKLFKWLANHKTKTHACKLMYNTIFIHKGQTSHMVRLIENLKFLPNLKRHDLKYQFII